MAGLQRNCIFNPNYASLGSSTAQACVLIQEIIHIQEISLKKSSVPRSNELWKFGCYRKTWWHLLWYFCLLSPKTLCFHSLRWEFGLRKIDGHKIYLSSTPTVTSRSQSHALRAGCVFVSSTDAPLSSLKVRSCGLKVGKNLAWLKQNMQYHWECWATFLTQWKMPLKLGGFFSGHKWIKLKDQNHSKNQKYSPLKYLKK